MGEAHVEVADGFCHIEFVERVHNDGGSREEGEPGEEAQIDYHEAPEPAETLH